MAKGYDLLSQSINLVFSHPAAGALPDCNVVAPRPAEK